MWQLVNQNSIFPCQSLVVWVSFGLFSGLKEYYIYKSKYVYALINMVNKSMVNIFKKRKPKPMRARDTRQDDIKSQSVWTLNVFLRDSFSFSVFVVFLLFGMSSWSINSNSFCDDIFSYIQIENKRSFFYFTWNCQKNIFFILLFIKNSIISLWIFYANARVMGKKCFKLFFCMWISFIHDLIQLSSYIHLVCDSIILLL